MDVNPLVRLVSRRSWLSQGLRRRLVESLCPPRPVAFDTALFGRRFFGRLDSYIDREVFYFGSYEPAVLDLIARLALHREHPVLLDVGANVGVHTLFASHHYAEVHAVEPYPPLVEILREQLARNGLRNVVVHPVGLGEGDDHAAYAAPADARSGYGGFDNHDVNLQRMVLPLRRGDTYLQCAGVERVDVVKIDVEGSERRVVEGLASVITRDRPALIMEYWPDVWPRPVETVLAPGYRVWALQEHGTRWLVFHRARGSLGPLSLATAGSTVLALPNEWPVPSGLSFE